VTGPPPLDRDLAGTIIVRDGRIVYASEAVAVLCERPAGEIVGAPYLDLVAPEDRTRLEDRYRRRLRGEAVPNTYEATLLLPRDRRRAIEVSVRLDGGDTVATIRDVTAQASRRPRLEALAALGAGIQRERSEAAVLARVREGLWSLGLSCLLMRADADTVTLEWARVPAEVEEGFRARLDRPLAGYRGPWTGFARRVWSEGAAWSDDWGAEAAQFVPEVHAEGARALAFALGLSRAVGVRLEERAQIRFYLVLVGDWLDPGDVAAVRLFGAQVAAALDAARAIADLSRRNAELAALSRLGELAGEAGDPPAFFARAAQVVRDATGCAGLAVYLLDEAAGQLVRSYASGTPPEEDGAPERIALSSSLGEVVRDRLARVVSRGSRGAPGGGAAAWVPLVARARAVGALAATFHAGPESVRARLEVLAAAAAPFAGAIEAHALFSDLRHRVAELTLLNDLAVASAQLDPVLLLDAALRRACETLEADAAAAYLRDGERLLLVTGVGLAPEEAIGLAQLGVGDGLPGLAVSRLAPVETREPPSGPQGGRGALAGRPAGIGPSVAVPLLAKSQGVGALVLGRRAARPFSAGDVSLLSAIGVQLGVSVEGARLFSDVRRRLSDLEAVHALALRVFGNAPGDVRALLDDGCREVARALGGRAAAVYLAEPRREVLRLAALWGSPVEGIPEAFSIESAGLAADAFRRRAPAWTENAQREPPGGVRAGGPPLAILAVPLTSRAATTRGVLFVADDPGRRFTDAEVALANALAGELAVGLENAELYADARRRVEELSLLHEVGRSLVETLDIEGVLDAGVRNLARIVGCERAFLTFATDAGEALEVRAVFGLPAATLGRRIPSAASAAGLVLATRAPVAVEDARLDPRVDPAMREATGARAYLCVPLLVRDRTIGVAVVVETSGPRAFTPAEVDRAVAVANQLAVAAENARLYEDLRQSYAELARAQDQLIQQERLAALGELSAVVAHEVRNPLGVIFNSLGSLRRLLRPTGDARMLLDIVGEEADRLNRIVGDLLDFARPSTPEFRPEHLSHVVDEAVAAALGQNPAGVKLVRDPDEELPPVPLDARLVRQAVLNVAINAVQAMPRGGRLRVKVRRTPGGALLEIEDSGAGIPEEVRHRIFEPFFTTKASGTGLGLAVVKRIVEGHGGEVAVSSPPGGGTVFALRFPFAPPAAEKEARLG
jgi:signal transduction histidine kinase